MSSNSSEEVPKAEEVLKAAAPGDGDAVEGEAEVANALDETRLPADSEVEEENEDDYGKDLAFVKLSVEGAPVEPKWEE